MRSKCVIVIGAGVIGLQCSIVLLEAGYHVATIAEHLPGDESEDYVSPCAGGHWRPHSTRNEPLQCDWDLRTYREWMSQIAKDYWSKTSVVGESGLAKVTSTLIWDKARLAELKELHPDGQPQSIWYSKYVNGFEQIDPKKIVSPTSDGTVAARFQSIAINVPKYLTFLDRRVKDLGGVFLRKRLNSDKPISDSLQGIIETMRLEWPGIRRDGRNPFLSNSITAFVNATGLGASALCKDNNVFPSKGQVLIVKGEANGITTRHGFDDETNTPFIAYVIPRPGSATTILGGSAKRNDWTTGIDDDVTQSILERTRSLAPELLTGRSNGLPAFEVIRQVTGRRPAREGGPRVELQSVKDGHFIVHAYGHGGAGFQNSVGTAHSVLQLINSIYEHGRATTGLSRPDRYSRGKMKL